MKELIKHFPYGVIFPIVVLLAMLVAIAMFFTGKGEDVFEREGHKITQTMELRGNWLGMKLTSLDSPTARRLGVPPSVRKGVMVVELQEARDGWRPRQAGVLPGDVIVAVDGKKVRDLADLYDASRNLDVGSAVLLDIRRWGQPMTLVLPAVYAAPPVAGPPEAWQGVQPPPATAQGANAGAAQLAAWAPGSQCYQCPHFYCRVHNQVFPQGAVHPNYRCPIGNCPLNALYAAPGVQPGPVTAQGPNGGAAQPAAWAPGSQSYQCPHFYCRAHNQVFPQGAVHPHYRCPVGNCPLCPLYVGPGVQAVAMATQGANAGAAQPAAWVPGDRGAQFYCPLHNRTWLEEAVRPHYRCLIGNCPLNRVR